VSREDGTARGEKQRECHAGADARKEHQASMRGNPEKSFEMALHTQGRECSLSG